MEGVASPVLNAHEFWKQELTVAAAPMQKVLLVIATLNGSDQKAFFYGGFLQYKWETKARLGIG